MVQDDSLFVTSNGRAIGGGAVMSLFVDSGVMCPATFVPDGFSS